jgi:hypothetical protein
VFLPLKATRAKVSILGADFRTLLLDKANAESLPRFLLEDGAQAPVSVSSVDVLVVSDVDENSTSDDMGKRAAPVPPGVLGLLPGS